MPTEAGLAFHRRVSAAFREVALAEAELCDTSGTLSGTLRVAGSAFFVSHHVVPIIRDFSLQHPGVRFDLRISEEFAEPISTGIDLMIRIGQLPASPMNSRKIASLRRVAIASPSYIARRGRPETPADLWPRLRPTPCGPRACPCRHACGASSTSWPNGSRRRSFKERYRQPQHLDYAARRCSR